MAKRAKKIYTLKQNPLCDYSFSITHANESDSKLFTGEKQFFYFTYKDSLSCENCGRKNNITFHHLDKSKKFIKVADMINDRNNFTIRDVKKEIEKCIPLCRSCHDLVDGNIRKY